MIIGIVGNGFVGKATALLGCRDDYADFEDNTVLTYDVDPEKRNPKDIELKHLVECDFVFVAVPTPMHEDGSCHTGIVESVVAELKEAQVENIIVRSTVPIGTCRGMGVNFMPEFLTEANWEKDFSGGKDWIFGLDDKNNKILKKKLRKTFLSAKHNKRISGCNLVWCSTEEAELVKMTRNTFLATKVSFFNEIYDFCEKKNICYSSIAEMVGLDDRVGESHTAVPGPDGKRGFGGTCFPKDLNSLYFQMSEEGMESYILEAAKARNVQVDRPEQDWNSSKGRAVV
jgi:UDPglucose 6-dehydrogenase